MDTTNIEMACGLLTKIRNGLSDSAEDALTDAITAYRILGGAIKELESEQAAAKIIVSEIMQETGQVKAITPAGTAQFTADSVRVSWDSKALDALCASDAGLAGILKPHRKETACKGSLTIK